jgi:hypothetical protein
MNMLMTRPTEGACASRASDHRSGASLEQVVVGELRDADNVVEGHAADGQ